MKIVFVSDFFLSDLPYGGGAEFNDDQLVKALKEQKVRVKHCRSSNLSKEIIENNKESLFIISNFLNIQPKIKDFIQKNIKYIIYEHDHKYLKNRNPLFYKDFKAPESQICNYDFYKNAKYVFCQSVFHKNIIDKNLQMLNTFNISGNLWKKEDLLFMKKISKDLNKKDICSILYSPLWNKNMKGTMEHCVRNGMEYELIADKDYKSFLRKMCGNSKFVFLPKSPETLSRICVEAKMLGCKVYTNKLIGANYESWFKKSGDEIVDYMMNIDEKIINKIFEVE